MKHIPVLFDETISALGVKEGGTYVDGTLGRAGHARGICEHGAGVLIGIDRDEDALAESRENLAGVSTKCILVHGTHGGIGAVVRGNGFAKVDGILLDLGVSSPQLDDAERGFSFMRSGPLDMRMDRSSGESAAELVATRDAGELERIFREFGEEREARRIAKAIVSERARRAFATTTDLAEFVAGIVGRKGAHHPATRVFQALRMAVNDEVGELERALADGLDLLAVGGRFAVITFESLTDRIVKRFFAAHAGRMVSLQQGGEEWRGEMPRVELVTKHPCVASEREILENVRSRSAKLRAVERIM